MNSSSLEHVNVTVAQPQRTAALLCELFDWQIRWQGASIDNGYSMHVGNDRDYIAIYSQPSVQGQADNSYRTGGGLNHIGVLVDDLQATEQRVLAAGLETFSHQTYEPGSRFYFRDYDGIEFEVLSYATTDQKTH